MTSFRIKSLEFYGFVLFVALMCSLPLRAQTVNEQDALEAAKTFLKSKSAQGTALHSPRKVQLSLAETEHIDNGDPAYYVFNNNDAGFVVVGAQKSPVVLGYSDRGTFDATNIPDGLKGLLAGYAEEMEIVSQNTGAEITTQLYEKPVIAPLCEAKWNQGYPYNLLVPTLDGVHYPAGCVATAMAIIMYHHRWPEQGYGTHNGVDFSVAEFDWNLMTPIYDDASSEASCYEVAELMSLCGTAVDMNYDMEGSGARTNKVPQALMRNFGYEGVMYATRNSYGVQDWIDKIYNELTENRPVLYAGSPSSGSGHAFVCDGYDGKGYFHLNFGWGGFADGYFMLHSIALDEVGTGGGTGNYSNNQGFVYGIECPDVGYHLPLELYGRSLKLVSGDTQSITFSASSQHPSGQDVEVELGIQVVSTQTYEIEFIPISNHVFASNRAGNHQALSLDLAGITNLKEGTYKAYPAFRGIGKVYSERFMREGNKYLMLQVSAEGDYVFSSDIDSNSALLKASLKLGHNLYRYKTAEFYVEVSAEHDESLTTLKISLNGESSSWSASRPLAILPGETQSFVWSEKLTGRYLKAGKHSITLSANNQVIWEDSVIVHEEPTGTFQLAAPIAIKNPAVVRDSMKVSYAIKSVGGLAVGYVYGNTFFTRLNGGPGSGELKSEYLELQEGEERIFTYTIKIDKEQPSAKVKFDVYTYEAHDEFATDLEPAEYNSTDCYINPKYVFATTDEVEFPDPVFRHYLDSIDMRDDDIITDEEFLSQQLIDLSNKGINSLKGIGYFTTLRELVCNNNNLDSLDVSSMSELIRLNCSNNKIKHLDASSLSKIEYLHCYNNSIKHLDVSSSLSWLECGENQLECLILPENSNLESLGCGGNQLVTLDLSNCDSLTSIGCSNNQIKELNLDGFEKLERVDCDNNPLEKLNLSSCDKLSGIYCSNTQLKKLDVSHFGSLHTLFCDNSSQLDTLILEDLPRLSSYRIEGTPLKSLRIVNLPMLSSISCYDVELNTIELEQLPNIKDLSLNGASLIDFNKFDFSLFPTLENINLYGNCETKIFSPKSTSIRNIFVSEWSVLDSLDVTGCPALESLSVQHCDSLKQLALNNDKLSTLHLNNPGSVGFLNLSASPALRNLSINGAPLYMLDLSNNEALENVSVNQGYAGNVQIPVDMFYNFDLTAWKQNGFDVSRMSNFKYCSLLDDNTLKTQGEGTAIYQYATGNDKCSQIEVWLSAKIDDPNEGKKFLITYIVDEKVYASDSILYVSEVVPLAEPQKEGYTFSGWSEIPELMPARDVEVRGTFTVNKYVLKYVVDGKVVSSDSIAYGTPIVPLAEPEKEGHTFSGWKNVPETMPAKDVEIKGTFTVNKYVLQYMVDGEVVSSRTVAYGTPITAAMTPVKEGHSFTALDEVPATMPAHDVVVNGKFNINTYMITYLVDEEVYDTDSVTYAEKIELIAVPEKEGYIFSGWSEVPATMPAHDLTVKGSFEKVDGIESVTHDTQVDVYSVNGVLLLRQVSVKSLRNKLPRGLYMLRSNRQIMKVVI